MGATRPVAEARRTWRAPAERVPLVRSGGTTLRERRRAAAKGARGAGGPGSSGGDSRSPSAHTPDPLPPSAGHR